MASGANGLPQQQHGSDGKSRKTSNKTARARGPSGLPIERRFTAPGVDPLDQVTYERRSSAITNPDGSIVFQMDGAEIPTGWSQLAADIVISKYFRKAGLNNDKDQGEKSVRQVVHRLAHTLRTEGEKFEGYFATKADADAFEAELSYLLVNQYGAFNSPVWFNLGLYHDYGITGQGGNWAWMFGPEFVEQTRTAYERPQCSACFIQSVPDDLMGIYDLMKSEARLFKYGSGTGSNFSAIRGKQEKLSGGGFSSGLLSFLEVFDRAAGSTKSGGTTRRAAKMVCLDMDHPEIVDFITWKMREEKKAHALIAAGYPSDFNGEAYHTISGQNSNNSVRVSDQFMNAVKTGGSWSTRARTSGEIVDTYEAKNLWRQLAEAAWSCADPGVQYDTTTNRWHTCPNSGRINASNPCSEYMFLDDTACNLASINLTKFLKPHEGFAGGSFDVDGYRHACRMFFIAQEILVDLSSYPTEPIAKNSHDYRPLGLGYANLGSLLMSWGVPYDSDEGRSIAASLTAIMCGTAYKTSAEMAASKGPFEGFAKNREPMLKVMRMHLGAAEAIRPGAGRLHSDTIGLSRAACEDWKEAVRIGTEHGYRNAQATVLAPTGTIGLLMDCDTTGVEPDFALVKFKKLAGGGHFKIVNQTVPAALRRLRYNEQDVKDIVAYISGTNSLSGPKDPRLPAPGGITRQTLKDKGLTDAEIRSAEAALPGVFDLDSAFASWVLGAETYARLGVPKDSKKLLEHLGFSREQIDEAAATIIGRMTIEGAPHLRPEDYEVFDCANRCGKTGKRFLAPMSHVRMMAAVQPFLSGAISKTVNLPSEATVEEVAAIYEEGWKLGLKAVALYRDGCKASQPLSTGGDKKEEKASEMLAPMPATAQPAEPQLSLKIAPPGTRNYGERARLPTRRRGFTQEARIGNHKIYIRTGEYEDGQLGEIFIDMHKEGAAFRSVMNCLAMAVSLGLQYGVPLVKYVEQFTFTRFEPSGPVQGHPHVKFATSLVDYIFRTLGIEYLHRHDLAHIKPEIEAEGPTGLGVPRKEPSRESPDSLSLQLPAARAVEERARPESAMDAQLDGMMGDAPVCDHCGHITVRNGACYRCLNCGNSMGCS
jgi:ribonucleoside-diphosphate reductase alpha chain